MSSWYAIFCKPRGEATAELNLRNQGYSVYLPRVLTRRRRAGKWIDCIEPLFPRYLFLKPRDSGHSLAPVHSTLGVVDLVRFGGQPAVVGDAVLEQLRAHESSDVAAFDGRPVFRAGCVVKFVDGPFSGLQAVFTAPSGADRAIVLLDLLGKMNRLRVEAGWLAPAA